VDAWRCLRWRVGLRAAEPHAGWRERELDVGDEWGKLGERRLEQRRVVALDQLLPG
jgi:hypothetical protein